MQNFKVGEYLKGFSEPFQEGTTLAYDESGLTFYISLPGMTEKEARAIAKNRAYFALFESDDILYFLCKIPGAFGWSDAPFHIGLYTDPKILDIFPENQGLSLLVIGLDSKNSKIKALRLIGLGHGFTENLLDILKKQLKSPITRAEYNLKINNTYTKYSCDKMAQYAIASYKAGVTE